MGAMHVHEFITLDGIIDEPTWTFDDGLHDQVGETLGAVTARGRGIRLGRTTFEQFAQSWPYRTIVDDP